MDEISLLHRVRNDIPERSLDEVARGRRALIDAATLHVPSPSIGAPRRANRVRWAGFSALAAGALTAALVATNVLGFAGWHGGADPAAASVLESAALASLKVSDPVPGPGQFLLVETSALNRSGGPDGEGSMAHYLENYRDELYIPADRNDDWVWSRHPRVAVETYGPKSEYAAQYGRENEREELLRAPAGTFYGRPGSALDIYSGYPRDPQRLLNAIYLETLGAGNSRDGEALVWIADTLRTGTVPAEFRAALYQAAAGIPGVTITEQQANLDGKVGIAIGRVETADHIRQDIIIDPGTGQFIGERQIMVEDGPTAPAGTIITQTAVTTSIVDSAPAGGTQYGNEPEPN